MKSIKFLIPVLIASSIACTVSAQTATATVQTPDSSAAASIPNAPADLAFGPTQVVKLQQGGLGKDILVTYVSNANLSFRLRADDIVYLHKVGVPDEVINAMMDKERNQAVLAQNSAPAPALVQQPVAQQPQATMVNPPVAQTTVVTQPPVVYTSPSYSYDYPYYGGSYYYGPPVSLSFGFGWGRGWGGWGGGWHGGWGGGWHGGGGHHH
jgi:hypothetical protein